MSFKAKRIWPLLAAGSLLLSIASHASDTDKPNTRQFLGKLAENSRVALDVSTRGTYYFDGDELGSVNAVGLDIFKVFTGKNRDLGTLVAQAYYTRIDNIRNAPGFFDDDHDGELVYRIFNFNFTGLPRGAPNVRIGHLEIPYGLEQTFDTNGTLKQFGLPGNLGIKTDWGVTLNQQHRAFEYEVALTTGGSQSIRRDDGSFTLSGRLGSNRDENTVIGASIYRSRLQGAIRERVGLDVQHYVGRTTIAAEISVGNTDGDSVLNSFVEVGRSGRRDNWQAYIISNYFSTDTALGKRERITAGLGFKYTPDSKFSLSTQLNHTLTSPAPGNPTNLSLQVRYRL